MNARTEKGFFLFGLAIAVIIIVADQLSKWWIVFDVMRPPRIIEVFPSFNLVMGWNRGVSFGMFDSDSPIGQWLLIGLALTVVIVLLVWLKRADSRIIGLAIGLIVGGALGNVIDRIHFGAVADFLDVYIGDYHWPAFNIADAGISVGAIILVLDSLFANPDRDKKGAEEKEAGNDEK
ncbi:MAG: signal peptidase II [Rhodospirillales bacterium]|jgi:signal peptidase II|nr:signal peptidase II [Rhodospirillales bacterium]